MFNIYIFSDKNREDFYFNKNNDFHSGWPNYDNFNWKLPFFAFRQQLTSKKHVFLGMAKLYGVDL